MTQDMNKAIAREHMHHLDRRDLEGAAAAYATAGVCYGLAPQPLDLAGWQQSMSMLLAAFPDSRFSIDDMIAEDDKVVVRHTLRGTHRGDFQGIPPTGKQVSISAIGILRIVDGKIRETWLNADFLGLLQQLGVVPAPEHVSVSS